MSFRDKLRAVTARARQLEKQQAALAEFNQNEDAADAELFDLGKLSDAALERFSVLLIKYRAGATLTDDEEKEMIDIGDSMRRDS